MWKILHTLSDLTGKLFDNFDPSFWSFDASHLDTCQCLVQFLGCRSHFFHSTWEIDFFVVVNDLANWRDNCSSSAKSAFCEVFDFIQIYFTFLNFESEIMFSNIDQGTTVMDGRMLLDFGVTTVPSLVTKMKFAPPVSSTLVLVAESRYMFSSYP